MVSGQVHRKRNRSTLLCSPARASGGWREEGGGQGGRGRMGLRGEQRKTTMTVSGQVQRKSSCSTLLCSPWRGLVVEWGGEAEGGGKRGLRGEKRKTTMAECKWAEPVFDRKGQPGSDTLGGGG